MTEGPPLGRIFCPATVCIGWVTMLTLAGVCACARAGQAARESKRNKRAKGRERENLEEHFMTSRAAVGGSLSLLVEAGWGLGKHGGLGKDQLLVRLKGVETTSFTPAARALNLSR